MGDMGDIFRDNNEIIKERRQKKNEHFEPLLKEIGAIEKSQGVWMLDDWLLYPTKGFAMHKRDYNKTRSLKEFINTTKGKENEQIGTRRAC